MYSVISVRQIVNYKSSNNSKVQVVQKEQWECAAGTRQYEIGTGVSSLTAEGKKLFLVLFVLPGRLW